MYDDKCDFCVEFYIEKEKSDKTSREILRQGNLVAFPSLGQLAPAHILLCPHYHVTSTQNMNSSDTKNFITSIDRLSKAIYDIEGHPPVFFEHGDPTGEELAYGQCISHAHLHVLSQRVDLLPTLHSERTFLGSQVFGKMPSELSEPYLLFSSDGKLAHYFSAKSAPRQYLRRLYGEATGNPDGWKWYEHLDAEKTAEVARTYKRALET